MSVKSVPGCLVTIAPSVIGVPVAFCPVPRPHVRAAAATACFVLVLPNPVATIVKPTATTSRATGILTHQPKCFLIETSPLPSPDLPVLNSPPPFGDGQMDDA